MLVIIPRHPDEIARLIGFDKVQDVVFDHLSIFFPGFFLEVLVKWKGHPDSINDVSDLLGGVTVTNFSVSDYVKRKCMVVVEFSCIVLVEHLLAWVALLPRINKA